MALRRREAILHLVSESGRKVHGGGAIDHVAINCEDIRGTIDKVKKADAFPSRSRRSRPVRLQQVFLHDPDGIMIELNFWHEADVPEIDQADVLPGNAMKQAVPAKKQLVGAK